MSLPLTDLSPSPRRARGGRRLARAVLRPFEKFAHIEGASGIALVIAVIAAFAWANSRSLPPYAAFWDGAWDLGAIGLAVTPRFVVNDVLMTLFFLVAGLELRRERAAGELRSGRRALLPVVAALGGMIVPALLYVAVNRGEAARGWAIPMATDIAFAIGVLSLIGRGIPASLRVFLLALAIIDDLGAILVVAVFYSHGLALDGIAIGAVGIVAILGMQRWKIQRPIAYVAPAAVIWYGLLRAHLHPTLAGVIVGLMTPVNGYADPEDEPDAAGPAGRIEQALHPWVAFGVMPVFALANAGIDLRTLHISAPGAPGIVAGIVAGLVIGKLLGVVGASALAVRLGAASLPTGSTWRGVILIGAAAGIGFTMSLFIAELAFGDRPELHAVARLGLLAGSCTAILVTLVCAWFVRREGSQKPAAEP